MKRWHWIALIIACIVIVAMPAMHYWLRVGRDDRAPDFRLAALDGGHLSLQDFPDKIVLLHFWATWCTPCRDELPALESLHQTFSGRNLVILGVSEDQYAQTTLRQFQEKIPFTFPVLLDEHEEVAEAYGVLGLPETLLIGRDGIIVNRFVGPQRWNSSSMLNVFKNLIDSSAPSP